MYVISVMSVYEFNHIRKNFMNPSMLSLPILSSIMFEYEGDIYAITILASYFV